MADHLPECPIGQHPTRFDSCICDWLRACEARVREDERQRCKPDFAIARAESLDAARDAVAALEEEYVGDEFKQGRMALRVALAAIDALKGEKT